MTTDLQRSIEKQLIYFMKSSIPYQLYRSEFSRIQIIIQNVVYPVVDQVSLSTKMVPEILKIKSTIEVTTTNPIKNILKEHLI